MHVENEKKNISTLKKLVILFIVFLAIFGIINIVWYFGYKATYDKLASKMDTEETSIGQESRVSYYKIAGEERCILGMPSYLSYGGQLCVSAEEGYVPQYDADGNIISDNGIYVSLYIWPQFLGAYELGVDFYSEKDHIWEQLYIDSELNLQGTENMDPLLIEKLQKLIDEHSDTINKLIDTAEEVWEIELR